MYHVILRVKNGGEQNVFNTNNRKQAASYCKSQNEWYKGVGSPNRYYFTED